MNKWIPEEKKNISKKISARDDGSVTPRKKDNLGTINTLPLKSNEKSKPAPKEVREEKPEEKTDVSVDETEYDYEDDFEVYFLD